VVPEGKARIRVQLSAAQTTGQVENAINQFIKVSLSCFDVKDRLNGFRLVRNTVNFRIQRNQQN